ncbi:MAG: non-canonical purine NTP pyrophosphatase [Planctomycetota bacterium]|nr:non-canonical purine NTP pyrophosphatase [Planctomycetota bacterium]
MRVLVIGTGNRHKVQEIAPLLEGLPLSLRAAGDYGPFHPDESGATAEENAVIARFVCVIALCRPGHDPCVFRGECPGRIGTERRGTAGFGYDPVFIVESAGRTFAELPADVKNTISHRALATRLCRQELERLLHA